jgi:uncharacterized damage-inducible protein DinB
MTGLRIIRMLMRYAAWSNERSFQALAELPEGEATAPRKSLFGNMVHTLNHNYVIDQIWQAHLQGRPHGFTARNTEATPTLEALHQMQREMDAWYIGYADTLTDEALDEVVNFTFVGGGPSSMTRGDILLHVMNHKSFHRGFVGDMMNQVPARAPLTDLPVFLRDVPLNLS